RTVLTFNPTARMAQATRHIATVAKGLRGARGGETANVRTTSFTTVGPPSVRETYPRDGERSAGRFGISLQFSSPMDTESLEGRISISGFSAQDLEGRVNVHEMGMGVNIQLAPRTTYTVRLAPGALDRYGQRMGGHEWTFTTGGLEPSVLLALPGYGGVATYSSRSEPILYFQTTNVSGVRFHLTPLTADEARQLMHERLGDPRFTPSQPELRTWVEDIGEHRDRVIMSKTSLSGGGPLPTGAYLVTTDGVSATRVVVAIVDTVIVTKLSHDELVAWVLDHDSGRPVAGVEVRAEGQPWGSATKVTDARGLASFSAPLPVYGSSTDRSYWLSVSGARTGLLSTRWQGLTPYQFGLPSEFFAREWVGHLYTDRPIYRPGETVFYKGVIRADDDAAYSLPPQGGPFRFTLRSPRGQILQQGDVRLNEFGSFNGFVDLPGDAPTGDYFLQIEATDRQGHQIASSSILIAEFRKPEFQVELGADRLSYVSGETIEATTSATFFFGGAVASARVEWSAIAAPFALRPAGLERYSFSDLDLWRDATAVARDPIRAKGTTTTDANGVARFRVPAVLNAAEGAQRFTVSASVVDQNGQAVGGGREVTVHPAALYAGVRTRDYVVGEGEDAVIELVSVDTEGRILGAREVVVKVYERQWLTAKVQLPGGGRSYRSELRDTLVATLRATTGAEGRASVTYRPAKSGQLRIVAEATDAQGRVARSATDLWAYGGGFALWRVTNDDAMKLVPDRDRYTVGDTAEILVPAPFAGATALVTVERGKVITREVRTFTTNSERIRVPITDRSVPDVFVSVVLYRGPTAEDPLPRYKVGYAQLPVSTEGRRLNVRITADTAQAEPRQTVRYTIAVTDASGKGVRSEVSVAVVDKAVLSLEEERGPDGMRAFWFERGLGVTTTSSMGSSLDRWNDVIAELPRVGKGGAGGGLGTRVREEFRNTAYWDATVTTSDDGTATVDVLMPDDLTTWRLAARAISGDTQVGDATHELVSTKPLLLRSALPRFVRVGDAIDLRVLVRNGTPARADVTATLAAKGVTLTGAAARTRTIEPGASLDFTWPALVESDGEVALTFTATGADREDAMTVRLPAYRDVTPETMSTGGIVAEDDARLEAVYLPTFANTRDGSLAVSVRSSLVGSLAGELDHFAPRPREGAEQVASRLLATVGVARAERSATGIRSRDSAIARDIAGLLGRQRPDGGWAWCDDPVCPTDPNVTAWVLLALGEARRDGYTVDAGVVQRAGVYVLDLVNRPNTSLEPAPNEVDQKAFLLAAVASSGGAGTNSVATALLEQERARLASWGRAYLLNALLDGGATPDDPQARLLLGDLAARTIPTANGNHWEDGDAASARSFMTSSATTALVALAIARARPDHALLPQTVRWLVVARSAQSWHTGVERAMGVLALATYAAHTGELGGDFSYRVTLDDDPVLAGRVRPGPVPVEEATRVPLSRITPGKASLVSFARTAPGAGGRLYYTLDLRYQTPAQEVEATNRGFAVSHRYTLLDAPATTATGATLGAVVRVSVTVIAPFDRSYVTIEDLLPAGLEAIDARLRTTDPGLRAQLERERIAASARNTAGGYMAPWYRWYYSPWQQTDIRDDRLVLKADRLPKGV
ncbi:MAG TPA: MG2 domain-containing protein, partial [Candidatus Limnocylindria bacterium]|nr:MG2 domain-containing protein [Candidatus Limnocylindria bacterium]